jgi:hypothetical protein
MEQFFETRVDHFNSSFKNTFKLRYLLDDTYFNGSGPMFFYPGNEADITHFYDSTGFLHETLAKEFGALIVYGEHRYYGKSMPFGDDSYKLENLKYLTVQNVLEDYLALIKYLKSVHIKN